MALLVSSVAFAGPHPLNPQATLWTTLALAVEAGALLAAAYTATRTLWLPVGIHLVWTWSRSAVYGTTSWASDGDPDSLLRAVVDGPVLLTGGACGIEGGLPAIIVCLVPTVLLLRLAVRRGHVVPRRATAPSAWKFGSGVTRRRAGGWRTHAGPGVV